MYDDHFYCETCDKHSQTCWCSDTGLAEPDSPRECKCEDPK